MLASTKELQEMSDATAAAGETEGAGTDDANDSHFICFLHFKGKLYELDGRTWDESGAAFPVVHGDTTPENWLADAAKVIREDFMARDPENVNFNVTALCKLED
jgi:ubiquitin carboxyl-terminal hydrolase L3